MPGKTRSEHVMALSPFTRKEWYILAAFIALGAINIMAHEIWRDEFQAFLIARESISIPDLLERMKYEGHPPLWHLLLFLVTRFSGHMVSMQIVHFMIACGSAYLILRFPLPRWQRVLMVFGYFPLFEFLAISRSYGLGFFLCNALVLLIAAERKRYLLIAALLFLLCLTSTYGIIMAGLFSFYLMMDLLEGNIWEVRKGIVTAGAVIILGGMLFSIMAIAPPKNSYIEIPVALPLEFDRWRFSATVRSVWRCYIPIPLFTMHFWDTNFLEVRFVRSILSIGLVGAAMACFLPKRKVFYLYTLGMAAILVFSYFIFMGQLRHFGHMYVLFTVCLVLYAREPDRPDGFRILSPGACRILLILILGSQAIAGMVASYLSWNYPFTAGKAVAAFIREEGLENHPIIGDRDWALTTVAGHLGKPLYHLTSRKYATYVVWDTERAELMSPEQVVEAANRMAREQRKDALVVLNYELKPEEMGNLLLVREFPRSVLPDEQFYLYKAVSNPAILQRVKNTRASTTETPSPSG